ncbi:hypothetical protein OKN5_35090 [Bacillus altitudinis]
MRPLFSWNQQRTTIAQNEQKAFIDQKRIKIHNIYFNSGVRYHDRKGWKWDTNI